MMDFRANNPGAVQFGNFINYYQFNSAEERVKLLPNNVWLLQNEELNTKPYYILDVGCNSGVFTQLLWRYLSNIIIGREVHILGVDIDAKLIQRAQDENDNSGRVTFATSNVMDDANFAEVQQYLITRNRSKFDVVCCFSITMWIHLNNHDKGLRAFIDKCSEIAKLFVIEPQPWKCYQTAVRRMKKSGEVFPMIMELKWRSHVEEEIQKYIQDHLKRSKVHETVPTKWKRRICFYR